MYPIIHEQSNFLQKHFVGYHLFPQPDEIPHAMDETPIASNSPNEIQPTKQKTKLPLRKGATVAEFGEYIGMHHLNYFFGSLKRVRKRKSKTRVAYFGDSMIEGDLISQTLRNALQSEFGGRGVGFVPTTSITSEFRRTIRQSFSPKWKRYSVLDKNPTPFRYGMSGEVFVSRPQHHTNHKGAWVKFVPRAGFRRGKPFPGVKLYYGPKVHNTPPVKTETKPTVSQIPPKKVEESLPPTDLSLLDTAKVPQKDSIFPIESLPTDSLPIESIPPPDISTPDSALAHQKTQTPTNPPQKKKPSQLDILLQVVDTTKGKFRSEDQDQFPLPTQKSKAVRDSSRSLSYVTCKDKHHITRMMLSGNDMVNELTISSSQIEDVEFNFFMKETRPIYGFSFEDSAGVYVDNFALRGNNGLRLNKIPKQMLQQFQKYMHYDLIILQFGLNAIDYSKTNYDWYEEGLVTLIQHLQSAMPYTSILVVSASDKSNKFSGQMQTPRCIPLIVQAQQNAAERTGVAFFNLFESMGGIHSMPNWVKKGLANKDYTHFNFKGAEKIGELLSQFLLERFDQFDQKRRPSPKPKRPNRPTKRKPSPLIPSKQIIPGEN